MSALLYKKYVQAVLVILMVFSIIGFHIPDGGNVLMFALSAQLVTVIAAMGFEGRLFKYEGVPG